jgi:hypothetical protein
MTRALVSIVLGLLASRLLGAPRPARLAAFGLVTVFAACGVAGGLARQDHFLSTWRQHRRELRSLVDAVPRARPATTLLLHVPHEPAYTALKVPYLAFRWSTLLWPDPSTRPRVFLWSFDAGSTCVAGSEGFRCRVAGEEAATTLPWDAFVLLTWRPEEGRFRREDVIPEDLSGGQPAAGLYRPRDLAGTGPPHPRAARLLRDDVALSRLLP